VRRPGAASRQVSETRVVEKGTRGHQQLVGIALDEAALEQRVEGAVAGRAANRLDAGAPNCLTVRDDGQHFQRRSGKCHWSRIARVALDRSRTSGALTRENSSPWRCTASPSGGCSSAPGVAVLAVGDLVFTHSQFRLGPEDRDSAVMDILRLENGTVVEHCDRVVPGQAPERPES
jgi:hypothetical protein